jgi:anti-sigma factor RsiW
VRLSCDAIRDLLSLHVDEALDADEEREVAAHLEGCGACREEEGRERVAWRALEAIPGASPPPHFAARVARAARGTARRRRLVPWAAAASVAIALVAGRMALRQTGGTAADEEVIAHLDLLESWELVSDPEVAVALDAPEEDLLPLGGENGR